MNSMSKCRSAGWLDSLAIGMSMVCAVHCLLTPILIIFLPILSTTIWVHEDFHLWMILFVVPTTSAAIFMGCRKHKDRAVFILGMIGLVCLVSTAIFETVAHSAAVLQGGASCPTCAGCSSASGLPYSTIGNVLGGLFLASAHVRNFLLCRAADCSH